MNKVKIIVVGGGLAGLSCAYELSKFKQCKVVLFEANDSLGGRVQSLEVNDEMVDFGGFIVYPWYKYFHSLLSELQIRDQISPIPIKEIFYDIDGKYEYKRLEEIDSPLKEKVKMWLRSFSDMIVNFDITQPDVKAFEKQSVLEYIRSISTTRKDAKVYEKIFDVIAQGYCYGPIDKYKAAFAVPIVRQTMLYGDIKSASFFRNGNNVIVKTLATKIKENGGHIHLNKKIVKVDNNKIYSSNKVYQADVFVFAQTMSLDIYKQIVPDLSDDFEYTNFITATLHFTHTPIVNGSADWGALFYMPQKTSNIQMLSAVNLKTLYTDKLCGYVNMNIVIRKKTPNSLNKNILFDSIKQQIEAMFPDSKCKGVVKMLHFEKAMPIATEDFVTKINESQGKNNYYFAGDYLGCPSMETALATGLYAAQKIVKDRNIAI